MFSNYLKVALRNLIRSKVYSVINLSGLAVGMACAIFIAIYVRHTFSYNTFHENLDRIYRINLSSERSGGGTFYTASTMSPLARVLKDEMPGISQVARYKSNGKTLVRHGDRQFYENLFVWADPALLEIFTFPLVKGDPATALQNPNSILITEEVAQKYFGAVDPMGKILRINNDSDFLITGVLQNLPHNSSLMFDFLASFQTIESTAKWADSWGDQHLNTFILLKSGVSVAEIDRQLPALLNKYYSYMPTPMALFLQPLSEIHMYDRDRSPRLLNLMYQFIIVAVIILLIASINYMNLATARAALRSREVGMRKVVGASRRQLTKQFLGESMVIAILALPVALILVELFLPIFTRLFTEISGQKLVLEMPVQPAFLLGLLALTLIVGFVGGSYPALVLSRFKPIAVFSNLAQSGTKGARFRKILVVTQFTFSIIFMIDTAIIFEQIRFLKSKDLGFEREQVVTLQLQGDEMTARAENLKNRLLQHHNILNASLCYTVPARLFGRSSGVYPEGVPPEEYWSMHIFSVDQDYLETFGLQLLQGRNFSEEMATDAQAAYIINETTARKLGWDAPIGKLIRISGKDEPGQIIGVVKDFHFQRMNEEIEPAILLIEPAMYQSLALRISPAGVQETMALVKTTWQEFAPNFPLEFRFFDEDADRLFRPHELMYTFSEGFAFFAVFIACLGLFGLAAFTAEHRTKEIGIRKVLGASVTNVVMLLSKNFLFLVAISFVIATPISYFAMDFVLQNFAYRTAISSSTFVFVGMLTLVIALATVSYQAIRAALANPVDALRYE